VTGITGRYRLDAGTTPSILKTLGGAQTTWPTACRRIADALGTQDADTEQAS
jgi:hypothetical protein